MPQAGKTILRAILAQGVGSGDLIVSPGVKTRIYVVSLIVTCGAAAGTIKFTSDSGDLTAVHDFAINGGLVMGSGDPDEIIMETLLPNEKLSVTVTGGPFHITARYYLAP
jgi:hypothetical protein